MLRDINDPPHLLGRDVECLGPHVNDLESVHTGNNKEDARAARPAGQEAAHPKYDGALELLDHLGTNERPGWVMADQSEDRAYLDDKHEAEGERDQDEEDGHQGQQPGAGNGAASVQSCGGYF